MGWRDILKSVLPEKLLSAEIKDNKVLDSLEEIKLASDNSVNASKQTIINHGTIIIQNGPSGNSADKMLEKLTLEQLEPGDTLSEAKPIEKLKVIDETFWSKGIQERIATFNGIVPKRDMPILESAIFIQALYDSGQRVGDYMRDISIRYRARGTMICHLYSAGYFDSLILPLYQELVEGGNPQPDEFNKIYEQIVSESPLAMFVSVRDTADAIREQLVKKIKTSRELGMNYLNIHGIGSQNLQNIKRALEEKEVRDLLVGEPVIETDNSMANVTIYF